MGLLGPNVDNVKELHDQGDIAGLVQLYGSTKRRDVRRAVIPALDHLRAADTVLGLLSDEEPQRSAAAALAEMDDVRLDRVVELADSTDASQRTGALYAVYYYARYRDLPEALEALDRIAAGQGQADVAEAASAMADKVRSVNEERRRHIEELLAKIALLLQEEAMQPKTTTAKMFSAKRRDRVDAMNSLIMMRWAALHRVIERAGEFGDAPVGALLGLGVNEIGAPVVTAVAEALPTADKRGKSALMRALLCLRQARIPGAAEAIEHSGIHVSDSLDRQAAKVFLTWVK